MTTDALTYLTRLPASACENHDFAGLCAEDCADLVNAMMGGYGGETMVYGDYLGGTSSVDWSGTHAAKPMPEEYAIFHPGAQAVLLVEEHPEDCQCSRADCPVRIREEA